MNNSWNGTKAEHDQTVKIRRFIRYGRKEGPYQGKREKRPVHKEREKAEEVWRLKYTGGNLHCHQKILIEVDLCYYTQMQFWNRRIIIWPPRPIVWYLANLNSTHFQKNPLLKFVNPSCRHFPLTYIMPNNLLRNHTQDNHFASAFPLRILRQ